VIDAPREVASTVEEVTFFEDRAEVSRQVELTLSTGVHWLAVSGIALTIDDGSVVASTSAPDTRVLGSRVERRIRQEPSASAAEAAERETELTEARAERQRFETEISRAEEESTRLQQLVSGVGTAIERVPPGFAAHQAEWTAAQTELGRGRAEMLARLAAATAGLAEAVRQERLAQRRLEITRTSSPRFEAVLLVQIDQRAATSTTVKLRYRVAAALWRPEHTARLVGDEKSAERTIDWQVGAVAWQRTGEDWSGVRCRFSTARPSASANPPLLSDDSLELRRKQDRTVQVEARDEKVETAGLDSGTRAVDDMPGVDDGGESLTFAATEPLTLPSDGKPARVELFRVTLPAVVETVATPELTTASHLRATATWRAESPLLAGPVRLVRGASIVGRSKVGFVGQGEPFELGFGVDSGLSVRRQLEASDEVTAVLGTQKLTRTVTLFVANLGAAPRKLTIVERIPKSELSEVKVELLDSDGAKLDDAFQRDGFVRWKIELAGDGTRTIKLRYRVEAGSRVQLRGIL